MFYDCRFLLKWWYLSPILFNSFADIAAPLFVTMANALCDDDLIGGGFIGIATNVFKMILPVTMLTLLLCNNVL